jgi:hypothetical protein
MSEVLGRVNRGAALLDEFDPGWWEVIDVDTIDISDIERCIIGQWGLANYSWQLEATDALGLHGFSCFHGFADDRGGGAVSVAWREAILWREYLDDQGLLP